MLSLILSLALTFWSSNIANTAIVNSHSWPLRYHHSPWLHEEFLTKNPYHDNHLDSLNDFDEFEDIAEEMQFKSAKCDDEDGCNQCFTPSIHCERQIKRRRSLSNLSFSLTVDQMLAISANETWKKYQNRKTMQFQQCHFLNESLIEEMCTTDRLPVRKLLLENLHLRTCRRYLVERALSKHLYTLVINSTDCSRILKELLLLDNLVEELSCEYESILHRYDCQSKWSVVWTCRDCKLAYRDWLCSVIIPYHQNGVYVKACQSVCEQVQQKCPHLHPYGKGQYAGEPVFLCIDPNIAFNKKITPDIPFGDEDTCYTLCDLEPCVNELGEYPILNCSTAKNQTISSMLKIVPNIDEHLNDTISNEDGTIKNNNFDYTIGAEDLPIDETLINNFGISDPQTTEFFLPTSSTVEEVEINLIDLNDNEKESSITTTTTQNWIAGDDDDYVITSIQDVNNKQKKSLQFVESNQLYQTEPAEKNAKIMDEKMKLKMELKTNSTELPSMASNIDAEQTFQEIYQKAMSPTTTNDPFDMASNEQLLLNDELNKESLLLIMKENEWNELISLSDAENFNDNKNIGNDTTLINKGDPNNTEIGEKHFNKTQETNYTKKNFYKYLTSVENENISGNRFRHFNSRNKDKNAAGKSDE